MIRQFFKKMISAERNAVNIQRCLRVNYCSDSFDGISDEMKDTMDETEAHEKTGFVEASFCQVHCIGRMGTPPKAVETKTGHMFVTFMLGCNNVRDSPTKWHAVNINKPNVMKGVLRNYNIGDRVYVAGTLSYVDGENYNKQYRIYCEKILLLKRSKKNAKNRGLNTEDEELDENDVEDSVHQDVK